MNITKSYKKTKYFHIFNTIFVKKPLLFSSESSNNPSINDIFSKLKSNFFTKASRLQRYSINGLNDFSVSFNQQRSRNSPAAFSFFLISETENADSRRQINDVISAKKALYHNSFDSSPQPSANIGNIIVITPKQLQRIINTVINNYVQRYSSIFKFVEFSKPAKPFESQKRNEADYNVTDNVEIFR